MIEAVIIEDEPNNQELLVSLISKYCPNVNVLGIAASVSTGIELIQNTKPMLVFMDFEIEGGNGFDILDAFDLQPFKVIFVTGYSEYAIKAIKYSALDYLLKPIDIEELISAVNRFDPNIINYNKNYQALKTNLDDTEDNQKQIVILSGGEYKVLNISEIYFIKAIQSYVEIYLSKGRKILSSEPLKYYEKLLDGATFFKAHKSYIININTVESVDQGRGGAITLETGHQIPIATRRKTHFLKLLRDFR